MMDFCLYLTNLAQWLLVAACTSPTSAADTLNGLLSLELRLGYATNASRIEIGLLSLDAS